MSAEKLITDHIDIWTSAIQAKSASGRGSSKKRELYGIKKLRELILELAVRGKLVPQDPNDEPASVLLERIAVEKAQLVKEGKIKKQKKLPSIDDDDYLFDIPSGWSWERLGNVGETNIGLTYSPKDAGETGIPVLRSANIQRGKIDLSDLVRVQKEVKDSVLVEIGDLLICARNGSKALVGKTAQICELKEPMAFGAFMAIFRSCINDYIEVFLNSPVYRKNLEGVSTTTINQITQSNLRSTICPIPPVEEQHRIVAKVDELMALCDQLEQQTEASLDAHQVLVETLLATLTNSQDATELMANWARISEHFDTLFTTEQSIDQLKQTILQLAVMGKLVPQDPNDEPAAILLERIAEEKAQLVKEKKIKKQKALLPIAEDEKPFELPKGWEWCRVNDISLFTTSGSRDWAKYYSESGALFVTMGNLSRGSYDLRMDNLRYVKPPIDGEGSRTKLEPHDLLISITGDVGNLGRIPEGFGEAYINQHTCLLRFMPECRDKFFPELMRSPFAKLQFDAPQRGIKNSFRLSDVGEMVIPLPPKEERTRITQKVDNMMSLCDQLKQRLRDSQQTQLQLTDAIVEQAL
ncbi:restriction endonuclease subunit S [Vibrio vulnificus]|uniref:restriction endonuclease subunit S n=1 Tax=Vibrio vulnificus TaxID=672 RepID=UPI0002D7AD6C|nr:restriction endonuclease subunit S [Vibrio vulnificus]ASM95445.1 restriction endonuclease subunit S [Vibrio vulnificus NBRC 15645 = ATCC 27562]EGR0046184.1 restriction endonuclease subunit S [Vibrio vulnificus]EKO5170142.1 restriction endonuclease subunit S [Vibrio vulnificus]ELG4787873.1 restriction endonuclease subunit S [Vibrio vulnificus]MCL7017238.1 restriction endonuclease subunit S [Vibrio vulnificus]